MIEESLLKSNFIGKDGFVWWIGQVADPKVWRNEYSRVDEDTEGNAWAYRCKVRIVGYHTFNTDDLPDDDLPWAHVLTSASDGAPAQGGLGKTHKLLGGEAVFGFFLDGEESQQPVVMSCFYRNKKTQNDDNVGKDEWNNFTGQKAIGEGSTRIKDQVPGTLKGILKAITDGPGVSVTSNNNAIDNQINSTVAASKVSVENLYTTTPTPDSTLAQATAQASTQSAFTASSLDTSGDVGSVYGSPNLPTDQLYYYSESLNSIYKKIDAQPPVKGENGCGDNVISKIIAAMQSFINLINRLESTVRGFIDPLFNTILSLQDLEFLACDLAKTVASILKYVINGVRDNIMVLIGDLLSIFGITLPEPQKPVAEKAGKGIMDIVFCVFEKIFDLLSEFLCGAFKNLIGKSPSVPTCAAEELTAAALAKISELVDDALSPLFSGLEWLTGGVSDILSAVTGALNILNQVLSFLSCDSLKCEFVSDWDPFGGVKFPSSDDWTNVLGAIGALGAFGGADDSLGYISLYGSSQTPFSNCRDTIVNPQTQDDLPVLPLGIKAANCIPPEIRIIGDGSSAVAYPVISSENGSILTISIQNSGKGYTKPPQVTIIDRSNYGKGAIARSKINPNGSIDSIYLLSSGSGYCPTDLNTIINAGIGTTIPTGTTTGISTTPVGIITSVIIDSPGLGYAPDDTVQIGDCFYNLTITPRGSIIDITNPASCPQQFKTAPVVTINTKTGQGVKLYPQIQYTPQYNISNPVVGIPTNQIVNVDLCGCDC
jgi:hypothetical protein